MSTTQWTAQKCFVETTCAHCARSTEIPLRIHNLKPSAVYFPRCSVMRDVRGEIHNTIDPLRPIIWSNTSGRRTKYQDLPYPVGTDTNTSFPVTNARIASRCKGFKSNYFSGTVNSSFLFHLYSRREL